MESRRPRKTVLQEDWRDEFSSKERRNFHLSLIKPSLSLPITEDPGNRGTCEITPDDTKNKTGKILPDKRLCFFNKYVAFKKEEELFYCCRLKETYETYWPNVMCGSCLHPDLNNHF